MDEAFKREGIDKMLESGEIEFLFISHEHLDHFWGLESTLKYNPKIKIIIPSTFYPEGLQLLGGADFNISNVWNNIPHKGELVQLKIGTINKLYEGCAAVAFDLPIVIRVRGEESLYFNVKDKGIICVTGCCHQNILTFADFARSKNHWWYIIFMEFMVVFTSLLSGQFLRKVKIQLKRWQNIILRKLHAITAQDWRQWKR